MGDDTYKSAEQKPVIESYEHLARIVNQIAEERGEWAGIPIPLDGEELVIEKKFPYRMASSVHIDRGNTCNPDDPAMWEKMPEWVGINSWWSFRLGCEIVVLKNGKGRAQAAYQPAAKAAMIARTLGASRVWSIDAETKANMKLYEMIGDRYRQYVFTGTFIETSKRSGVKYIFRKLRPTIALRPTADGKDMRILCALCAHPIGYYRDTWAGVLTPTDDVIAALTWMRGDEPKFWAMCSQHDPRRPQAGL